MVDRSKKIALLPLSHKKEVAPYTRCTEPVEGEGLEPIISVLKSPGGIGILKTGVRPFELTFLGAHWAPFVVIVNALLQSATGHRILLYQI